MRDGCLRCGHLHDLCECGRTQCWRLLDGLYCPEPRSPDSRYCQAHAAEHACDLVVEAAGSEVAAAEREVLDTADRRRNGPTSKDVDALAAAVDRMRKAKQKLAEVSGV